MSSHPPSLLRKVREMSDFAKVRLFFRNKKKKKRLLDTRKKKKIFASANLQRFLPNVPEAGLEPAQPLLAKGF